MIITTDVLKYEQQMNKLNEEVFPEKQRLNLRNYINDEGKNSSVVAIVVNETFAGFAIVLFTKEIAHLIYLAIEPSMQGDGLGSQVLHQLIEYFKQPLIADVENDEVICDNHGERVSRINFYIRNGFNRTSVKYRWSNEEYLIVSTDPNFNAEQLETFWSTIQELNQDLITIR